MINRKIGLRIKSLRAEKSVSQEELASSANLDRTYINSVENGRRNITVGSLYKITKALNVELKDFFDFSSLDNPHPVVPIYFPVDKLVVDESYSNKEISQIFSCANTGGIRVSNKNKTIVLITALHKKTEENPYGDSVLLEDGTFVYTGMGMYGDQVVTMTNQNGKIAYSGENGYKIYYFISPIRNVYIFKGQVELNGSHYFVKEEDANGDMRNVVKFPLRIME